MARVRRTRYVLFLRDDEPFLDIEALLRGEAKPAPRPQLYALSLLTGHEAPVTEIDLQLVLGLPADDWVTVDGDGERARELALAGVILSDEDKPELAALRHRDTELAASGWNVYGAAYYLLTRWRDVDLRRLPEEPPAHELEPPDGQMIRDFFAWRGSPPAAFPAPRSARIRELPLVDREGSLYDVLARRKTTRGFDPAPISIEELSVVLRYVFGCHGYARVLGEVVTLKKTSPSAGGLHPVEAYPLVSNVSGLDPGLYHYGARDHTLELVDELDPSELDDVAARFVCGQTYLSSAHVLIVLTARFERAHWKYVRHPKAFGIMLMDAAHLSQTLYLVATELGLGACTTAAINNAEIDERLGLDPCREGAIAVCVCGRPAAERSPFDPEFQPFVPRQTVLED